MSRSIAALFQRLTQGVYVVGVAHGAVRNAFTAAYMIFGKDNQDNSTIAWLETEQHHYPERT